MTDTLLKERVVEAAVAWRKAWRAYLEAPPESDFDHMYALNEADDEAWDALVEAIDAFMTNSKGAR